MADPDDTVPAPDVAPAAAAPATAAPAAGAAGDEAEARVVAARMKLKARFEAAMAASPAAADPRPQGSGPLNRHGMPKLPVGQVATAKWPVLDLGRKPVVPLDRWRLILEGEVERRLVLDWAALQALPQVEVAADFHCVTGWSRMDLRWRGVALRELAARAGLKDTAQFAICFAHDEYSANLPLHEALKPDVLVAHTVDGAPLPVEHGGPARLITPQLYAWKGAKWIERIKFTARDAQGFWEARGYSNTAHPWRNDRYS